MTDRQLLSMLKRCHSRQHIAVREGNTGKHPGCCHSYHCTVLLYLRFELARVGISVGTYVGGTVGASVCEPFRDLPGKV